MFIFTTACASQPDYRAEGAPPATVAEVDLERYAGLWHEIARYPNRFQRRCGATTAEYALKADRTISVLNTCQVKGSETETISAEGRARVVEGSNGARLKVKFAPAWVPFAEGDYWIMHLEPDYSAALVGDPGGKYLWILARAPNLEAETRARVLARAEELGFATEPLVFSQSL